MTDEAMTLLDDEATLQGAKHFWGDNVLSIALGEVLYPPLVHSEQSIQVWSSRISRMPML